MVDTNYIYLLGTSTGYDIYIVDDGGRAVQIGDTQIDLSDYYTKVEADGKFVTKVDADSKYATITTADGKIDKDKIVTVLDNTVTDEQVASARIVKELFDSNVINLGFLNCSVDDVPVKINTITTEYFNSVAPGLPVADDCKVTTMYMAKEDFAVQELHSLSTDRFYIRTKLHNVWRPWKRLCSTTVADAPRTFMTLPDGNSGEISYMIKNGFATITIFNLAIATSPLVVTGLPIPATYVANPVIGADGMNVGGSICYSDNDKFVIYGTPGIGMYGVVTYPVAE